MTMVSPDGLSTALVMTGVSIDEGTVTEKVCVVGLRPVPNRAVSFKVMTGVVEPEAAWLTT